MKAKLSFVLMILALTLSLPPAQSQQIQPGISPLQCAQFCAVVLCLQGYTCGLYTNPSGQKVCGCHL